MHYRGNSPYCVPSVMHYRHDTPYFVPSVMHYRAHLVELMTPDELDALTSEPQLDYSDEEENQEEERVPLTELEICKMEVKALAS